MHDVTNIGGRTALAPRPALWGGFECSVTRVHDVWRDQVRETGHHDRLADLDLAAALGLSAFRYPLVWERVLRDEAEGRGWSWHDERVARLRRLGITIIAGLLHHGSGPAGTHLLDPAFPALLAGHAGRVAARYPDIVHWTPVNEPLTTARFSCLYGVWYPHHHDEASFLQAVVAQCRAVLLSVRAIRRVTPHAQLVQTEDLSRVFATPPLQTQAEYENGRRWLSLDLLSGMVGRGHPWRQWLETRGVPAEHLDELATGEAKPDIIAANHYVTSDRYLDHRTRLYPPTTRGGNGRQKYADTEAVRVNAGLDTGWLPRLRELWERYRIPVAVGEAHLGGSDEADQARWFVEAWTAACALQAEGGDVRAVTTWALAGSVDWDSLMRERRGRAEAGLWDFTADPPRPRLLATVLQGIAENGVADDRGLSGPGWWRRDDRFHAKRA